MFNFLYQLFLISTLYAFLASTFTLTKLALMVSAPFFFVGFRMIVAGAILLTIEWHFFTTTFLKSLQKDFWLFVQIVLFHIYFAYMLDFWAMQYISTCDASLIYSFSPFMTAVLAWWFLNEHLTILQWLGMVISFIGFLPTIYVPSCSTSALHGVVGMFGAAITSAYGWIVFKELIEKKKYSPLFINGISMLLGGIAALMSSFFVESWNPLPVSDWSRFGIYTVLIILIGNFIFYNGYGYLLKYNSPTFLSYMGLSTPLFVAFFGWFFINETINATLFIALFGMVMGMYLFYNYGYKQEIES